MMNSFDALVFAAMDGLLPFVIISMSSIAAAVFFWFRSKHYKRIHELMVSTPTSPIRTVQPGPAEVCGRVRPIDSPVTGPYSQRPCAYYWFRADEWQSGGSNKSGRWFNLVDDRNPSTFLVEDETGTIEVTAHELELDIHEVHQFKTGVFNDPPPHLRAIMNSKYGRDTQGIFFNKKMRFTEHSLAPGDRVYVFGKAERRMGDRMRLKKGEMPLIVTENGERKIENQTSVKGTIAWTVFCIVFAVASLIYGFWLKSI